MAEKHLTDGTTALAAQPRVIKIEAAEKPRNAQLRVAAYTRVSSDSDDQLNSFAAQNRYYAELISGKAEWRMVDIYADEGITGTSAAKREDFQRMMADCRRGLIGQIPVKSISRFARNTKDCLEAVRELKELGVNVRFEREGIDTANVSSELITAIYAAFAQKESESISGNMRWSYQRRMEAGTFLPSSMAYGYKLVGRKIEIDADAALVVCRLYYKLKHQSLPILEQMLETLRTIRDRRLLWSEDIVSLNKKISELSSQNQTLAFLKQNGLVDPDIFISKSNELTRQLRQAKLDKEKLMAAEGDATAQRTQELIALLEDGPDFLDRPDTELCGALVAEIIVESNDTLRFRLHNGLELRESIERTVR